MVSERKRDANRRNLALAGPLTDDGRRRLRQAAMRNRPWEASTGAKTEAGKSRARTNALRHGRETATRRVWRRDAMRFLTLERRWRRLLVGWDEREDVATLVAELVALASRLQVCQPTHPA